MVRSVRKHRDYKVFGDESVSDLGSGYALFFVPIATLASAEKAFQDTRHRYGIFARQRLHASELFSPTGRARTPFRGLVGDAVFQFNTDLLREMRRLHCFAGFAFVHSGFGPGEAELASISASVGMPPQQVFPKNEKTRTIFAFKMAMFYARSYFGLQEAALDVHVDGDDTRIWFLGKKSKLSDRFTFDHQGEMRRATAHFREKPPLLQIADLLAYLYARWQGFVQPKTVNRDLRILNNLPYCERHTRSAALKQHESV